VKLFLAVDRDGTVDTGGGPVPLFLLRRLMAQGHMLYIVGNPLLQRELGVPGHQGPEPFSETLKLLKAKYTGFDEYVVVDNEPQRYLTGWEGWTFLSPHQFVLRFAV
jgi:hypothetical protein